MTYHPNIPLSSDIPSISQAQFLENFGLIDTYIGREHNPLTFPVQADRGKHKYISFPILVADPGLAVNESGLFVETIAPLTQRQLYFKRQGGNRIQMTGPDPTNATSGCTFLPGGLLMKWDKINIPGGNSTFTFPRSLPAQEPFSAPPYSICIQLWRSSGAGVTSVFVRDDLGHEPTATTFETVNPGGAHDASYIVIGPK